MVKDLNESRKDPERSASAKQRKPPPNPWAKLRAAEADNETLATQLKAQLEWRAKAERQLARADWHRNHALAAENLAEAQERTLSHLANQPKWWQSKADWKAKLEDLLGRQMVAIQEYNTSRSNVPIDPPDDGKLPPGNIHGLQNTRGTPIDGAAQQHINQYNQGN